VIAALGRFLGRALERHADGLTFIAAIYLLSALAVMAGMGTYICAFGPNECSFSTWPLGSRSFWLSWELLLAFGVQIGAQKTVAVMHERGSALAHLEGYPRLVETNALVGVFSAATSPLILNWLEPQNSFGWLMVIPGVLAGLWFGVILDSRLEERAARWERTLPRAASNR